MSRGAKGAAWLVTVGIVAFVLGLVMAVGGYPRVDMLAVWLLGNILLFVVAPASLIAGFWTAIKG